MNNLGSKTKELWKDPAYRERMRLAHIGQIPYNKGKKSPEISKGKMGHIVPQEVRDKISRKLTGSIVPQEVRDKIKQNNAKYWLGKKRLDMTGEKHFAYIKDRTQLKKTDHRANSANWEWKKQCKIRDNHTCKINNQSCSGNLVVHHILSYRDYPELRYDINNGITLCHFHHPRKYSEEERLSPYFQELVKQRQNG